MSVADRIHEQWRERYSDQIGRARDEVTTPALLLDLDPEMLAVAREGLSDLRMIGQAYRWLIENRELIGMAVPQFAIDAWQTPRLRLLVDQADLSAGVLQPMLQSEQVTVQAYRKLRWGAKLGLFLEAA